MTLTVVFVDAYVMYVEIFPSVPTRNITHGRNHALHILEVVAVQIPTECSLKVDMAWGFATVLALLFVLPFIPFVLVGRVVEVRHAAR